jgi:hypothetical protein
MLGTLLSGLRSKSTFEMRSLNRRHTQLGHRKRSGRLVVRRSCSGHLDFGLDRAAKTVFCGMGVRSSFVLEGGSTSSSYLRSFI